MTATSTKPKRRRKGTLVRFVLDRSIPILLWLWFTLTWPFWAVQFGLFWLVGAIRHWWASRSFWLLLAGLPAIFTMVFAGYTIVAISLQDPRQLVERYRKAAKNAMTAEKYADAKVYLERVLEFQRGDRDALFDLAKAAANTNDSPRAASAMLVLAPEDHPVYGPAHLWQAVRLLSTKPMTLKAIRSAETHLTYAVQLNEDAPAAHRLLGDIYSQQGQWMEALPHLTIAAAQDRSHTLLLARAYSHTGDKVRAKRFAEDARDYYTKLAVANPQDIQSKFQWADACMFLEEYPQAINVLREAKSRRDDPTIRHAMARVYISWSDSITGINPERLQQKYLLLAEGVREFPDEMLLFDRIMRIVESDKVTEDAARDFLNTNLVEGKGVGLSHLILGSIDFKSGKVEEAALHIERAHDLLPNAAIVSNNFAWLLIHADPPQTDRALKLIESCLKKSPTDPRFLDTRGHGLLKLGKYREAANDLEMALGAFPGDRDTHTALAEAYDHLGLIELAEKHRRHVRAESRAKN